MAHDVVGVRVAAVLVVRRHHLRPEAARIRRINGADASSTVSNAKQPSGSGGFGSPSGQPGVDEAQPVLGDAEDVAGALHLLPPDLVDVLEDARAVHLGVEDRAALTAGAGRDMDVHALGDVPRRRCGTLARLVVGVRVHVHQAEAGAWRLDGGHARNGRSPVPCEHEPVTVHSHSLPQRYGAPPRWRRHVLIGVVVVVVGALAALWTWITIVQSDPSVSSDLVASEIVDDHTATAVIRVEWGDDPVDAKCTVRAIATRQGRRRTAHLRARPGRRAGLRGRDRDRAPRDRCGEHRLHRGGPAPPPLKSSLRRLTC